MRLAGKVAIVTGAGSGIGRACAETFAREGACVVVSGRSGSGEPVAQEIRSAGGEASFVRCDVSVPDEVAALVGKTVELYGGLDILVSSAGIGRGSGDGPTHLCTVEAWDAVMQINLRGTFLACKYAIPELLRRGGGSIVTVSSVLGVVGTQGLFDTHAYMTTKAGIVGLTRTVAAHYARDGVRANCVAPGLIDTKMAARTKADDGLLERMRMWQPLGPLGDVADVAGAALYLASDESRFVTGIVLPVDGGWTAQ